MSRHQYDLVQCMKQPGKYIGQVCPNCDGRCPICDSFVKPTAKVHICQDCSQGHLINKCLLCGNGLGLNNENGTDAYYCLECCQLEKHREGCPRVVNVGSNKTDYIFSQRKDTSKSLENI
ncbi:pre-mRNA-splicing factor [Candida orthopsilosis Co 90-125]|uniref:Pre-mRNA-splicing factor n=1 Tax=Candida orthopsilosis (strain 90-125) TaxID=1136231 RepID=H8WZS2_CANO9|nr:pre-mRNA-splicing factor [Candida orthopsilosis Co 90-125]CCG22267.1 pre-mRNA-splicing factor [Candida orthopsilosis Co 90-125]